MQQISAYILTFNEAAKIEAASRQRVVGPTKWWQVRSTSADRTAEIASALGARAIESRSTASAICGQPRHRGLPDDDRVFSLDADERCTEAVRSTRSCTLLAGYAALRRLSGTARST